MYSLSQPAAMPRWLKQTTRFQAGICFGPLQLESAPGASLDYLSTNHRTIAEPQIDLVSTHFRAIVLAKCDVAKPCDIWV
jgi:hypothetical protein